MSKVKQTHASKSQITHALSQSLTMDCREYEGKLSICRNLSKEKYYGSGS